MNRKLILLNVVLVLVVAFAGVQLRKQWKAAKQREAAKLGVPVKSLPEPKYDKLAQQPPVVPAGYIGIAQKMLFDRSRDPGVVVEAPPPPPPPPPMPPLPVYHGLMNIGGDPIALLSAGSTGPQGIHPGDKIGQFKLLSVNTEVISFEWNGQTVQRNTADLAGAARGQNPSPEVAGRTEGAAAPPPPMKPTLVGPGEDTGRGSRVCNVNDGNSTGAVVDGYKKVTFTTPFGQSCAWEPAR